MLENKWFLGLVIVVLIGHAIAFVFYAFRILAKDKPEFDLPDEKNEET